MRRNEQTENQIEGEHGESFERKRKGCSSNDASTDIELQHKQPRVDHGETTGAAVFDSFIEASRYPAERNNRDPPCTPTTSPASGGDDYQSKKKTVSVFHFSIFHVIGIMNSL